MLRIKRKQKILKLLPEKDIITTLKDFGITKEEDGYTMIVLSVVEKDDVIIDSNGIVTFKIIPKSLNMYEHNKVTYEALKDLYKNQQYKQIVEIKLKSIDNQYILDFTDYNSVQNTFKIAKEAGAEILNDRDLLDYATTKMCPRKRIVRMIRNLGDKAFEGSKTAKYRLDSLTCYDKELIEAMKII